MNEIKINTELAKVYISELKKLAEAENILSDIQVNDIARYPDVLNIGDETYKKSDLIRVAQEYGDFYLLQDHFVDVGITNVSLIKTYGNDIEFICEQDGKIFVCSKIVIYLCVRFTQ